MTRDELMAAALERFGGRVWVREEPRDGWVLLVCGVTMPGGKNKKQYEKSISFDSRVIPGDALEKIEGAIA